MTTETPFMAQRRKLHELRDKQRTATEEAEAHHPAFKKKAKKKGKKKASKK